MKSTSEKLKNIVKQSYKLTFMLNGIILPKAYRESQFDVVIKVLGKKPGHHKF